ncbi:hypothetical protein Tco_0789729, partial [Tanacetum coccineum]
AICGHGGPLKTFEDIDDLTKGIELGKYEVWLGMTSDKRKEVTDTLFAMWDVVNPISSKPNSYANVTSGASVVINKHDATSIKPPIKLTKPVVILGVSIASKEELIRLVNKIELSALDDVISGLTTAEHQAAHALVLELARGFQPIRDTPSMVSHIDDIVKSVSIQDKPSSYVGAAGGSTPEPSKAKANFRSMSSENLCEGIDISIPRKVVETINDGFQTVGKKKKKGKSKAINGGQFDGHSVKHNVRYEPKAIANVPKNGATNVGNASKSGLSQVSSLRKNQPLKAIVPPTKEGKRDCIERIPSGNGLHTTLPPNMVDPLLMYFTCT